MKKLNSWRKFVKKNFRKTYEQDSGRRKSFSRTMKLISRKYRQTIRQRGPIVIEPVFEYYPNKQIRKEKWYKKDKGKWFGGKVRHRDGDLPAVIYYNIDGTKKEEFWYKDGKLHRDGDLPASILYDDYGAKIEEQWWENGKMGKTGLKEWIDFTTNYKEMSEQEIINKLRDFYQRGWPVPTEPHSSSVLDIGPLNKSDINYFSLNRDTHIECHRSFSARLRNLLKEWIYGDYSAFNTNISLLNGEKVNETKISSKFLEGYSSVKEAYDELLHAIMKVPALDHDIFAWRGVHGLEEMCNVTRVGELIGFSRLTACSVTHEVSCTFAEDGELLLLEIPKGANLLNLTCIKESEPEFILPDRCCFKLVNRFSPEVSCSDKYGNARTYCKEILHLKLIGIYNKEKNGLQIRYDQSETLNPEDFVRMSVF